MMSFDKVLCIEDIFITFMNIRNSAHRVVYELLFNECFSDKTFFEFRILFIKLIVSYVIIVILML